MIVSILLAVRGGVGRVGMKNTLSFKDKPSEKLRRTSC